MRILKSVKGMRRLADHWHAQGRRVAFVPTMGYLHAGHLSLVKRARQFAGRNGKVVVSIYVNPTQFGPKEDLSRYPRDFGSDRARCGDAGVDAIFAPPDAEMYPEQPGEDFSTYVVEEQLSRTMEGASRPTHFRGVTTVVAKLFNIVRPHAAVFGAKDWQQAAIIQRMVKDLNFPVRIIVSPIWREADGLAMSSRNKYLEGDLRRQALVLWKAIQEAKAKVRAVANPVSAARLKSELKRSIEREPSARMDYAEFFDADTLEPVARVSHGTHLALAVHVGTTRLIDNARL